MIRELTHEQCTVLLSRNDVGRIAFAFGPHIDILPVHYVYHEGWIYGRTSPGRKIESWRHSQWVAFEVDEVRDLFDWTSVIVHGGLYRLAAEDGPSAAAAWEQAITLLRRIVPATATPFDPVPHRSILFRIHVAEIAGRAASPPPEPS